MLEDFYVTSVLDYGRVIEGEIVEEQPRQPRSHAKRRKDPTWAVLCVLAGSFLSVAAGVFFTVLAVTR